MKPECKYTDINFLAQVQPGEVFHCSYPSCTAAFIYSNGHEGLQQVEGVKRCDQANGTIADLRIILASTNVFKLTQNQREELLFRLKGLENEASDMDVDKPVGT